MNERISDIRINAGHMWKAAIRFPLTRIIYEAAAFVLLTYSIKEFLIKPALGFPAPEEVLLRNIQGILTIAAAFLAYWLVVRVFEKRKPVELALKHLPAEGSAGVLLGFATVTVSFLILFVLGVFSITGVNHEFTIAYPLIWVFLLSMNEELIFRGFIYRIAEEGFGTHWALIISAIPFGVMHVFNDQGGLLLTLSALSGGLVLGISYTLTKRLWVPIFFHSSWNLSQVLSGSNVSATDMFDRLLESRLVGPDWLAGGATGMEGSVVTIGLVIFVFLSGYAWSRRSGRFTSREMVS